MRAKRIIVTGLALIFLALLILPGGVSAQDPEEQEQPPKFKQEELVQMLAPIALYPDSLIAQVLMASTYPLEIVEAERWMRQNTGLTGEALDAALLEKNWDSSVKSLCHFPDLLFSLSEKLDQTRKLGDAFLSQEDQVMATIQDLRLRARQQGSLKTTDKQEVIVEREVITIAPVNPEVIYVPVYDPFSVYGPWWYTAYPPYYWYYPPGFVARTGYVSYAPPVFFGFGFSWAWFDWHVHHIHVDYHKTRRFHRHHDRRDFDRPYWRHNPAHRRGVAYRDIRTSERFGMRPGKMGRPRLEMRGYPQREADPAIRQPSRRGVESRGGNGRPGMRREDRRIRREPRGNDAFLGIGNGAFERKAGERGGESRRSSDIRRAGPESRRQGGEIRRQGTDIPRRGGPPGSGRSGGFRQ